jgi:predicted Holliday junction resolvase-like endonuclease
MSQEVMNIVILPILAAIVPMVVLALKAYTDRIKAQIADQRLKKYMDIAEDAVHTAVLSTYQTFVSSIKGTEKWDDEAQAFAFKEAKRKALLIMGYSTKVALNEFFTDFDDWLNEKIEQHVSETP